MDLPIELPQDVIKAFCSKWRISELSLFGSILRDYFGPESDVDVLVKFSPDSHITLFDLVHMQVELSEIFGKEVDLVEKSAVEKSRNYLRRKAILGTAEVLYAS